MIYYNNSSINDWNFGDDNIIKVYRNGAVVFYKFDSEQGGYKVCYAVVDDITQYQETEFEDVYDKATEKWYKLNNLGEYEKYGVYGSGRTSCEGSASRLPQGYTEVEYIENTSTSYINTGVYLYDTTTTSYEIETKMSSSWHNSVFEYLIATEGTSSPYNGVELRWNTHYQSGNELQCESVPKNVTYSNIDNGDGTSAITISCTSTNATNNVPLSLFCGIWSSGPWRNGKGKIYDLKITKNDVLVRDLVPAKRDSDDKYGMYDLVTNTFYLSPNNVDFSGGEPITPDCVTTYEGKLTIDDGYEYEWNGSSWVNVGEVSGSSKTSDFKIGDIKERVTTGVSDGDYLLFSYYRNSDISKPENIMSYNPSNNYLSNLSGYGITTLESTTIIDPSIWLLESTASANTFYIKSIKNNLYWGYQSKVSSRSLNLVDSSSSQKAPVLITPSCKENCYGFVEKKSNASTGYGGYGLNQLYSYTYQLNWWNDSSSNNPCTFFTTDGNADFIIYKMNASDVEYPKYYSEKSEPLNDLTFNTMEDALDYAYNNCVYDGMKATIGTDRYYFDSEDENGWVKILEYYIVEDVSPDGTSGWTITGSSTYNPNLSYYDDFSVENNTRTNKTKIAKVTIYGYDSFTYYLRSTGRTSYAYATSTNIDTIQSDPTGYIPYNGGYAITNTYQWNKTAGSAVNLSNYRRVTYNNLDKTVEHTFYVSFYGKTYSSYYANATILIPKEQTNENWEQVTFSASSNVASVQKSLYIDGNNSTSGGTSYWYYRWIIGLPAGSHSSYTNYSNYSYCPNVTSSTFTSVAGEQRQVNFTYDNTTDKTLSFRLVDTSGNTLSPSNTVYYNMTYYNNCGVSASSSNVTFPRSQSVKVGGRFRFASSSNRHYIYGYSPNISLNYDYYVDNYQSTFYITYTKLSEEAVTITYTTYDPNDSETPTFNTDITWPYNGGTTSSTTLTSFDVPYTYPYEVSQTSDKFSADGQSYTAGQAARTINFVLYPNNREFATVADMEAYAYAWEGMKANVGDTNYKYENGWVEVTAIIKSLNEIISESTTATSNYVTTITPTITGIKKITIDLTKRGSNGSYCYLTVSSELSASTVSIGISSYNTSSNLAYTGGNAWGTTRPQNIVTAADTASITWCYRDPSDSNKIIIDFYGYFGSTFSISGWQYNFYTTYVVAIER